MTSKEQIKKKKLKKNLKKYIKKKVDIKDQEPKDESINNKKS